MIQQFTSSRGDVVAFIDRREMVYSARCQPRDIEIVSVLATAGTAEDRLKEEIAVDIRLGMGEGEIGVAKNLKFK